MSLAAFRLYLVAYLDKDYTYYADKYDGTLDAELTIEYIKAAGVESLKNPVIEQALKDAIRRTPAYKAHVFERSKNEIWAKLNNFERWLTTVVHKYRMFKKDFKLWFRRIELYFHKEKGVTFPACRAETATEDDKALLDFLHVRGQDIPPLPEQTVVVAANIDKHAEGIIVKELYGVENDLIDEIKIKSYNIVPDKNPYDGADEKEPEKMGSWDNKAHFVQEGCIPAEE